MQKGAFFVCIHCELLYNVSQVMIKLPSTVSHLATQSKRKIQDFVWFLLVYMYQTIKSTRQICETNSSKRKREITGHAIASRSPINSMHVQQKSRFSVSKVSILYQVVLYCLLEM